MLNIRITPWGNVNAAKTCPLCSFLCIFDPLIVQSDGSSFMRLSQEALPLQSTHPHVLITLTLPILWAQNSLRSIYMELQKHFMTCVLMGEHWIGDWQARVVSTYRRSEHGDDILLRSSLQDQVPECYEQMQSSLIINIHECLAKAFRSQDGEIVAKKRFCLGRLSCFITKSGFSLLLNTPGAHANGVELTSCRTIFERSGSGR